MSTRLLTIELLNEYEDRLRTSGLSFVRHLRPGLSRAAIEANLSPLGLRLPSEAQTWFEWHDGFEPTGYDLQIAPSFVMLTLDQAITWYRERLEDAQRLAGDFAPDVPAVWEPDWFPLLRAYGTVACDCSVPPGAPTPIRLVNPADAADFGEPRARSLGEMITLWIAAWDSGAWCADLDSDVPHRRRLHKDSQGRIHPLLDV